MYLWRGGRVASTEQLSRSRNEAIPNISKTMLRRLEKDRLLHISDIVDDISGFRRWAIPTYARRLLGELAADPPTGDDVLLWPGQYWRTQGTSPTGIRRMNDNAVVEIECVKKVDDAAIAKCWEPTSRTARVLWYEATKTIEILIQELFHRNVATRVDAKGQLSHSRRCHFKKDRTLPRHQLGTADEAHMPGLQKGWSFVD